MPRRAREKSSTGIYHVMFRGINGQIIFQENEDYEKFIQVIREYKEVCGYKIYAYCLMSNHVHLLIEEGKEDFAIVFRRIGAKYVYWYNLKYIRSGHLFQDRYKSEAVENDSYFLTVIRYIHQNPMKAGITSDINKYPWNSYHDYFGNGNLCETKFVLNLFSDNEQKAIKLFREFNIQENDDKCLDYQERVRIDDTEAKKIIIKSAGVENLKEIQNFEMEKRDKVIKKLKTSGLSIRQIERLTGVSFGIIRKI